MPKTYRNYSLTICVHCGGYVRWDLWARAVARNDTFYYWSNGVHASAQIREAASSALPSNILGRHYHTTGQSIEYWIRCSSVFKNIWLDIQNCCRCHYGCTWMSTWCILADPLIAVQQQSHMQASRLTTLGRSTACQIGYKLLYPLSAFLQAFYALVKFPWSLCVVSLTVSCSLGRIIIW